MSLTLCLRHPIPLGLNLRRFFTETLPKVRLLSTIEKAKIPYGRSNVCIGDIFRINGRWEGEVTLALGALGRRVHYLGADWSRGTMLIEGDVGDCCGLGMSGGRVIVEGSCGDLAAAEMKGGEMVVKGDCAAAAASATKGVVEGMSGGSLRIHGNVGERLGERMRRGTVVVDGDCGEYAAAFMKGGTIIVKGKTAAGVGYLMKRGSLFLLGGGKLGNRWKPCGGCELSFFGLVANSASLALPPKMQRYVGDIASLGKGEIFTRR